MTKICDAIIIGAGQAGPFLAQRLAGAGMKVAIFERKLFGGMWLHTHQDYDRERACGPYG